MKNSKLQSTLLAASALAGVQLEKKEADFAAEIKKQIDEIGQSFEAFKATNVERWKEIDKKKSADVLLEEKLTKIGASLDGFIEQKNALEKKLESEIKEREELELRISRGELSGKGDPKAELELKTFNNALAAHATSMGRAVVTFDAKQLAEYKVAYDAFLRKDSRMLTPEEAKTLSVGSDPDGGYLVPPDQSGEIIKKVYETSDIRRYASVLTIGSDVLEGIEDLGEAGTGYAGEHAQGSDTTTPQIGKWSIPTWIIDTEPKVTQKLLDDANVNVESWLAEKIADKFARFENTEFLTGASRIRGLLSYPSVVDTGSGVTWGSFGVVKTGVNGAFAATTPADILFDVQGLLKNAYLGNAKWSMRRKTITAIRKMKESTTNAYMWQPGLQQGVPERLLGYELVRMEDMSDYTVTGALGIAFGDFAQAYQIVDRIGIRVLRDPFTAKPYVKFYTTKRVGGGAKNYEAMKFVQFAA